MSVERSENATDPLAIDWVRTGGLHVSRAIASSVVWMMVLAAMVGASAGLLQQSVPVFAALLALPGLLPILRLVANMLSAFVPDLLSEPLKRLALEVLPGIAIGAGDPILRLLGRFGVPFFKELQLAWVSFSPFIRVLRESRMRM